MKRLLPLVIGLAVFCFCAQRVHAAEYALSPEVNLIIARAQEAVDDALHPPVLEEYFFSFFEFNDWIREKLSTAFAQIDTRYRVVRQGQSLASQTACFRYDQWLLEQLLDGIRYEIDLALERRDVFTILRLQEAYGFVGTHLNALVTGGTNPEMENTSWATPLTVEEGEPPDPERLCMFNSDYTPPSPAGYGCDAEMIGRAIDLMPSDPAALLGQPVAPTAFPADITPMRDTLQRERDAALQAYQITESQLRLRQGFSLLRGGVDGLVMGGAPETPTLPDRMHLESVHGCTEHLPRGIILKSRRTPFSVDPDEWSLLLDFWQQWRNAAVQRPSPGYIANTKDMDILTALSNVNDDSRLRDLGVSQAEWESAAFAIGADPGLSTEDAFAELRAAVALLARLGNTLDGGLRGFVRDFAYWLDRSCLNRPCGTRLSMILKLVFADECFPYGNGEYLQGSADDPQWKRCLCAAESEAPGCD